MITVTIPSCQSLHAMAKQESTQGQFPCDTNFFVGQEDEGDNRENFESRGFRGFILTLLQKSGLKNV